MLIGVLATTLARRPLPQVHWQSARLIISPPISATAFKLDIPAALHIGLLEIVFVFLFVDLFDNIGTLVAVSQARRPVRCPTTPIPRLNRIFFADATATIVGSLTGTRTVTSYIECSAGVAAGGRTGVTAIVTGISSFLSSSSRPLVGAIPSFATAPALILVGASCSPASARSSGTIPRRHPGLSHRRQPSLSPGPSPNGLSFGLTSYALIQLLTGRARPHSEETGCSTSSPILFLLRFIYIANT